MKREILNFFEMKIPSKSINEGFARMAVSAFASQTDPTIEQLAEIKTVISEAITNAVVHGYQNEPGIIHVKVSLLKGQRGGNPRHPQSYGTPLHYRERRPRRHGLYHYANLYGQAEGGFQTGQRNHADHGKSPLTRFVWIRI